MTAAMPSPRALQFRNVALLSGAQALSMTGVSVVMLTTGLAGSYLAADPKMATVPLALQFLVTMCATFPAAMFMRRRGRRPGFMLGQVIGLLGAALSSYALIQGSFTLFLAASVLLGVHNSFWSYFRFAAAEASDEAFRNRAMSLVLAGGIVASIVAPELAKATRGMFAPALFAGCYAAMVVLNLLCLIVLSFTKLPPPLAQGAAGPMRPWAEILAQPKFIAAVLASMVGYGVMILIMSATPLAMADCGLTFDDTAFIIQWHTLAMFTPSFFTGDIIKRIGAIPVVLMGLVLNVVCVVINAAGVDFNNFWAGLVALGLGWNFLYIGGTALLTETYRPAEREKVQAVNDTMVFAATALCTFASAALHGAYGWVTVNVVILAPMALVVLAVAGLMISNRRVAATS